MATIEVAVGRQPVFDEDLVVVGYELLAPRSPRVVTSTVLVHDAVRIGLDRLVGDKTIFCDLDAAALRSEEPVSLPCDRAILEIDASATIDDVLLCRMKQLVADGFVLALDHIESGVVDPRLVELVGVVKIFRNHSGLVERVVEQFLGREGVARPVLVALGVETREDFEQCRAEGFDYFQGNLLSHPQVVNGKTIDSAGGRRLELACRLAAGEFSASELEDVIRGEPAMAYQLLQMAAVGAAHGMRREVRSLREAIVLLGSQRIRSWLSCLLLSHSGTTTEVELVATLARARTCELVATQLCPARSDLAFTAGMISSFDAMLGVNLGDVLDSLSLDDELRAAACGEDTEVGRIVADVIERQGGLDVTGRGGSRCGASDMALHAASITALGWALDVARAVEVT
ncbi:MAG: EAL and HDOD domain-containing protein [Acidimicrobiales bacterium]